MLSQRDDLDEPFIDDPVNGFLHDVEIAWNGWEVRLPTIPCPVDLDLLSDAEQLSFDGLVLFPLLTQPCELVFWRSATRGLFQVVMHPVLPAMLDTVWLV